MEVTLGHRSSPDRTYPDLVLAPARSARLAAWGTAVLRGQARVNVAVHAVTGDDEPHQVRASSTVPATLAGGGLAELLAALAGLGIDGLRLVLPRPGDALGLPGPAGFNREAVEAGECVLTEPLPDGRSWGLVPQITPFGSEWEPGTLVTWRVCEVATRRVTDVGSLAEAERELREALRKATEAMAALDVGRWRQDAAHRISQLRSSGLPDGVLPATASPRSAAVLATALRVAAIIDLAIEDDGGAVTAHEAGLRRETLRGLDGVTRRAVTAAVNALLEPTTR
jgi:hypothetical protein